MVVPEVEDEDVEEDVDKDKEPEIDLNEPDHMEEDINAVVPRPALAANIAHIVVIWAAEMAAQPSGFEIGDEELAEAIVEAEALVAAAEATDDELDEDEDEDDEDIEDDEALLDDDEEIAADLPEKMTFGPDDDIPPYESD